MADYLSRERSERFAAWLEQATPDEWHQSAASWNWGSGTDHLRWIAEQPDCDKATALLIFWHGSPDFYWKAAADRAGLEALRTSARDTYNLLAGIASRWRTSGFTRAELAYDPGEDWGASPADVGRSADHPALAITEDMTRALPGRELEIGAFDEGLPFHLLD